MYISFLGNVQSQSVGENSTLIEIKNCTCRNSDVKQASFFLKKNPLFHFLAPFMCNKSLIE